MSFTRETRETYVSIDIGPGRALHVETPLPFLTHMVETFLFYAGLGGRVEARERRQLDDGHHLIEDIAIALGRAIDSMLDRNAIARFGWAAVPMDDAFSLAAVDLGGRAYWVVKGVIPNHTVGGYPLPMFRHWVRSLSIEAKATIHIYMRGFDSHHKIESAHKALGLAFRQAMAPSPRPQTTK